MTHLLSSGCILDIALKLITFSKSDSFSFFFSDATVSITLQNTITIFNQCHCRIVLLPPRAQPPLPIVYTTLNQIRSPHTHLEPNLRPICNHHLQPTQSSSSNKPPSPTVAIRSPCASHTAVEAAFSLQQPPLHLMVLLLMK